MIAGAVVAALAIAYGWFEAGWLRTRVLEVPVAGLPAALDGLRIAHLSDFHLGPPSRGAVAVRRAADWVRERDPDLVVVTGDLLSHPRGRAGLDEALRGLDAYVVLGNHDVAVTRDPFSRPAELDGLAATLLQDESITVVRRGERIQLSGIAPLPDGAVPPPDPSASLHILLSHYPRLRVPGYQLVLAGHMHAGQIVLPYPGGKIRFAHLRARLTEGMLPPGRRDAARLTGPRHDVRALPALRAARGDRARSARIGLMEGHAVISPDVLASYAADAALEVEGVHGLVGSALHRHEGVKVSREEGKVGVELHVALDWGASAGAVGAKIQANVAEYFARMADVRPDTVDVVVDAWHHAS